MRYDILNEYSTMVPFGLGISKCDPLVRYPTPEAEAVERGILARFVKWLSSPLKLVTALGQIGGDQASIKTR